MTVGKVRGNKGEVNFFNDSNGNGKLDEGEKVIGTIDFSGRSNGEKAKIVLDKDNDVATMNDTIRQLDDMGYDSHAASNSIFGRTARAQSNCSTISADLNIKSPLPPSEDPDFQNAAAYLDNAAQSRDDAMAKAEAYRDQQLEALKTEHSEKLADLEQRHNDRDLAAGRYEVLKRKADSEFKMKQEIINKEYETTKKTEDKLYDKVKMTVSTYRRNLQNAYDDWKGGFFSGCKITNEDYRERRLAAKDAYSTAMKQTEQAIADSKAKQSAVSFTGSAADAPKKEEQCLQLGSTAVAVKTARSDKDESEQQVVKQGVTEKVATESASAKASDVTTCNDKVVHHKKVVPHVEHKTSSNVCENKKHKKKHVHVATHTDQGKGKLCADSSKADPNAKSAKESKVETNKTSEASTTTTDKNVKGSTSATSASASTAVNNTQAVTNGTNNAATVTSASSTAGTTNTSLLGNNRASYYKMVENDYRSAVVNSYVGGDTGQFATITGEFFDRLLTDPSQAKVNTNPTPIVAQTQTVPVVNNNAGAAKDDGQKVQDSTKGKDDKDKKAVTTAVKTKVDTDCDDKDKKVKKQSVHHTKTKKKKTVAKTSTVKSSSKADCDNTTNKVANTTATATASSSLDTKFEQLSAGLHNFKPIESMSADLLKKEAITASDSLDTKKKKQSINQLIDRFQIERLKKELAKEDSNWDVFGSNKTSEKRKLIVSKLKALGISEDELSKVGHSFKDAASTSDRQKVVGLINSKKAEYATLKKNIDTTEKRLAGISIQDRTTAMAKYQLDQSKESLKSLQKEIDKLTAQYDLIK